MLVGGLASRGSGRRRRSGCLIELVREEGLT